MSDCGICCEEYKGHNKKINCKHCDFECCKNCAKTYILGSINEARCMKPSCGKLWDREFLIKIFSYTFVNKDYKKHREDLLYDLERAKFEETLAYIESRKDIENVEKELTELRNKRASLKRVTNLENKKRDIAAKIRQHYSNVQLRYNGDLNYQINYLEKMLELKKELQNLEKSGDPDREIRLKINDEISKLQRKKWELENGQAEKKNKPKYFGHCPRENCKGLINATYKCGLCETVVCKSCKDKLADPDTDEKILKEIKEKHECDKNTLATLEEIKKSSKPCPKCKVPIIRSQGCFAKDTPILLYNGNTKPVQDIKIGDKLVGDNDQPRIVEKITSGKDNLYKVTQNNGISYTVNSYHTLVLKSNDYLYWCNNNQKIKVIWLCRNEYKRKSKIFSVKNFSSNEEAYNKAKNFFENLDLKESIEITVEDYLKLEPSVKSNLVGYKSSNGINYEYQQIELDPYMLGLWLGDGTHTRPVIATKDKEIIDYLQKWCENNDCNLTHPENYKYRINKNKNYKENHFMSKLRKYNLVGNKHIPLEFLQNSEENRLKLLAGLIDSDGNVNNKGKRAMISNTNKKLIDQIEFLCRSLGFIVNISSQERKNMSIFGQKPKDYKTLYKINLSGNISSIPTLLPRKKCFNSKPNKDYNKTSIKVEYVGYDFYYGFLVNDNNRFVLPDYTVVKNCRQMWCTECHVAFDWKTGEIVISGTIHNPHYLEWKRKKGSQTEFNEDGNCVDRRNDLEWYKIKKYFLDADIPLVERMQFTELLYFMRDIRYRKINELNTKINNNKWLEYRVKYMKDQITEKEFKRRLQIREKEISKFRDHAQIFDMLESSYQEYLYELVVNLKKDKKYIHFEKFNNLIEELIVYTNESFQKLKDKYKNKIPLIEKSTEASRKYDYDTRQYVDNIYIYKII